LPITLVIRMTPLVKIVGGALGAVSVAGGLARHLAWYVSHQMRDSSR
jgi:hypothetical protein